MVEGCTTPLLDDELLEEELDEEELLEEELDEEDALDEALEDELEEELEDELVLPEQFPALKPFPVTFKESIFGRPALFVATSLIELLPA